MSLSVDISGIPELKTTLKKIEHDVDKMKAATATYKDAAKELETEMKRNAPVIKQQYTIKGKEKPVRINIPVTHYDKSGGKHLVNDNQLKDWISRKLGEI